MELDGNNSTCAKAATDSFVKDDDGGSPGASDSSVIGCSNGSLSSPSQESIIDAESQINGNDDTAGTISATASEVSTGNIGDDYGNDEEKKSAENQAEKRDSSNNTSTTADENSIGNSNYDESDTDGKKLITNDDLSVCSNSVTDSANKDSDIKNKVKDIEDGENKEQNQEVPKRRQDITMNQVRKAGVALAGGALVGIGSVVAVAPTPGGVLMIGAGMAVLGTEFPQAQRVLDNARDSLVNILEKEDDDDKENNADATDSNKKTTGDNTPDSAQQEESQSQLENEVEAKCENSSGENGTSNNATVEALPLGTADEIEAGSCAASSANPVNLQYAQMNEKMREKLQSSEDDRIRREEQLKKLQEASRNAQRHAKEASRHAQRHAKEASIHAKRHAKRIGRYLLPALKKLGTQPVDRPVDENPQHPVDMKEDESPDKITNADGNTNAKPVVPGKENDENGTSDSLSSNSIPEVKYAENENTQIFSV